MPGELIKDPHKRAGMNVQPRKDGRGINISMDWNRLHGIRVALAEGGHSAAKSTTTEQTRRDLDQLLAYAQTAWGKGV